METNHKCTDLCNTIDDIIKYHTFDIDDGLVRTVALKNKKILNMTDKLNGKTVLVQMPEKGTGEMKIVVDRRDHLKSVKSVPTKSKPNGFKKIPHKKIPHMKHVEEFPPGRKF